MAGESISETIPDSVFFLLDEDRDRLLGAVNIRHYLNESLLKEGELPCELVLRASGRVCVFGNL